jgi:hypothetical protein
MPTLCASPPVEESVRVRGDASFPDREIGFGRATIRARFGVAVRNPGKSPGISVRLPCDERWGAC